MTTLNLTPDQAETLKQTLNAYLSDLRMEIVDTDKYDFREMLKKWKAMLKEILAQLEKV